MRPFKRFPSIQKRFSSFSSHVETARKSCLESLRQYDKSSYVLSAYVPEPARDAYIAIRAFNLEVSKITGSDPNKVNQKLKSTLGFTSTDMRIKFWEDLLLKLFQDPFADRVIGEPVGILLREALRNELKFDPSHFDQILTTRNDFLQRQEFRTVDDLCSYGEGQFSQLNYLEQDLLLSDQISPSTVSLVEQNDDIAVLIREICAHLGQATGVATIVLATQYYARHTNRIYLPVDVMTSYDLSQEDLLRLFQGHEDIDKDRITTQLKDVVYETCITANDHLLTARSKLKQVKELTARFLNTTDDSLILKRSKNWKCGLPDCLFVPFMNAIPLHGYLNALEKNDFNIVDSKFENSYWKLVYKSYSSYKSRTI